MENSHTTNFIYKSEDYFAAYTDNNQIRIGLVGVTSFQFGKDHPAAVIADSVVNSDDVENLFDDFMSGVYGEFKYNG